MTSSPGPLSSWPQTAAPAANGPTARRRTPANAGAAGSAWPVPAREKETVH
ncbi:hypothetical protein [Promicromonospora sp. NPDC023987]|uniref:hypothetical protein n=1 Tax=Promicromonospora sp. NPDC023987 TaxID=3155360 RepID=UPI0033CBACE0